MQDREKGVQLLRPAVIQSLYLVVPSCAFKEDAIDVAAVLGFLLDVLGLLVFVAVARLWVERGRDAC